MGLISKSTDMAEKIRIVWQSDLTGNYYNFKFQSEPTQEQIDILVTEQDQISEINTLPFLQLNLIEYKEIITDFIIRIKERPNTTLNQYNTFLGTLPWYNAAIIRSFVFLIAQKLADYKDISLNDLQESTVLLAIRNFIVNNSAKKLQKMFFNEKLLKDKPRVPINPPAPYPP